MLGVNKMNLIDFKEKTVNNGTFAIVVARGSSEFDQENSVKECKKLALGFSPNLPFNTHRALRHNKENH